MKHINKGQPPVSFVNWKNQNPNAIYDDLRGNLKSTVKNALLSEQGYICCYCCASITTEKSHIEHVLPRSRHTGVTLEYTNILASCNGYKIREDTCGHKKGNTYNSKNFISPLDIDCDNHFTYSISGKISEATPNDFAAKKTIELLNLNAYDLINARRKAISMILHDDDIQNNISQEIKQYSNMDVNGKYQPFCNAILFALKNLL